jgi:hypothetical protein
MAIWDKLKDGIDKANKVAQDAIDEGKVRMDARRARSAADKAAESLGYAVFRAWERGRELEAESLERMARALRDHEQEAVRLEGSLDEAAEWRRRQGGAATPPAEGAASGAAEAAASPEAGASAEPAPPPPQPSSGDDPSRPPVG